MEVRVPESLGRYGQTSVFILSYGDTESVGQILPGQKLVSSGDPTGAGLSSDGWLQDWHLGSVSSDYWEHTEANGNSLHMPAGIPLANHSRGRRHSQQTNNKHTTFTYHI